MKLRPEFNQVSVSESELKKDHNNLTKRLDQLYNRFQDEFSELRCNIKSLGSDLLYRDESDLKQKYNELERSLNEKELYYETQIKLLTESLKQLTDVFRLPTNISHSSSDNSSSEEVITSEDVLNSKEYREKEYSEEDLNASSLDVYNSRMDLIFDEKFASMIADDLLS
jgi:DNA gyrase/topoisomerase IV subunit A